MLKNNKRLHFKRNAKKDVALSYLYPHEIVEIIHDEEERPNTDTYTFKQVFNMVINAYVLGYNKANKKRA